MQLVAVTTVGKSPQEVYDFWHAFDRLPTFMTHLDDVTITGEGTSHWTASAPFGKTVEWDAKITEDVPGERISWESVGDADVSNQGSIRFVAAPGDRGTEVSVTLSYDMPAGKLGETAAKFFGEEPSQQLGDDLRRFKQVMETGEIARSDGSPGGHRAGHQFPQRPAQPMSADELKELNA